MAIDQPSLDTVRECLSVSLGLNESETHAITSDTTAWDLEKWTSLSHQALILELENRLGIEFDILEIVELVSVKAILDAIQRIEK